MRTAGLAAADAEELSPLGQATLAAWEKYGVATADIEDELARHLLLLLEAARLDDPTYAQFFEYWRDLRASFNPILLINNWDALYVLNYLDFRRDGFAPGDRYRTDGVKVADIEFDLDEFASTLASPAAATEGAERVQRAISGKVPRGRHRATFCAGLEIIQSSGASLEVVLQDFGIPKKPREWKALGEDRKNLIRQIVVDYGIVATGLAAASVAAIEVEDSVDLLTLVDESSGGAPATSDDIPLIPPEKTLPDHIDFEKARVEPPVPKKRADPPQGTGAKKKGKVDYSAKQAANDAIGKLGEEFAMRYEKWRLRGAGELAEKVVHVALEDDGAGFDVSSFDPDGTERFVEVKATAGRAESLFFVTEAELRKAKEVGERYVILRVFDLATSPKCVEIQYPFDGKADFAPAVYAASFKGE
ncbi:MAG: DUF3883 domain-containing protein [Verrucomicrobiaceae bacterium]|nr:MAG: DUF3883 domain-containing protein [Verrucomicrobiaceae bacterium]